MNYRSGAGVEGSFDTSGEGEDFPSGFQGRFERPEQRSGTQT